MQNMVQMNEWVILIKFLEDCFKSATREQLQNLPKVMSFLYCINLQPSFKCSIFVVQKDKGSIFNSYIWKKIELVNTW